METLFSIIYSLKKRAYLMLGFFFIGYVGVYCQDQTYLDSLEIVYSKGNLLEQDRLDILLELARSITNPQNKLLYSIELLETAQALDSSSYLYDGFLHKGNALSQKGDLPQALESYFQAAKIATAEKNKHNLGIIDITIADVYSFMGNHDKAVHHYRSAIKIHRENDSILMLATALENLGDEYLNVSKPDSALIMFEQSGPIFKSLSNMYAIAMNIGNKGIAYALQGKDDLAKENMDHAIVMLERTKEFYPISVYLSYISDIYLKKNNWAAALAYAERSLELAQRYGLKDQISEANLQLSNLYEQADNPAESLKYYKDYTVYKDSVKNITAVQQLADLQVSQKQTEVDLLNQQKKNQRNISIATAIALFFIVLLAFGLYRRYRFIRRTKEIIEKEKGRSDSLLLNILPEETAEELKQSGKVQAKKFDSVTVLFTDFEGFTNFAENLSPEKLVESVDFYFSKFDEIMEKYELEKIKTVGDSYMCAGGLPFPTEDHAKKMVQAAFEMAAFVKEAKKTNDKDQTRFNIRIGINTGPVVAGVVGSKKFSYDIWGDAVNIASRMESNSEPGKINISENTYALIKDTFDCEYRGKIKAKNRGMMKMYFVNESKPH